jgi:chromosome segregation ATPase
MRQALPDCSALDTEITELGKEVEIVAGLVDACVKENASYAQSQETYTKKYNALLARYDNAMARLDELATEKERRQNRDREIKVFIEAMKTQPLVLEKWDERLWMALIDRATVRRDGGMVFRLKNGMEIMVEV